MGVLPISHSLAALAIHIRKGGHLLLTPTVHVQERLYVLEYRSPTGGGKGGGGGGGGDNFCGRGTISASGLRPWGTISASRLCPGGQNLRGDRICSDSGMHIPVNMYSINFVHEPNSNNTHARNAMAAADPGF